MEKSRKELNKIKKNNAKMYPMYKMLSWDLLFFYSVEFLIYTITKKVTPSDILLINAFYLLFRTLMQIPAVMITDFLGKKKSIVLGNICWMFFVIVLMTLPGVVSIIIANMLLALGKNIKIIAEPNLLYDSVATKGGEGLYSKIEAKGGSWYYILDGVASLVAGYLFVINQYIPLFICLGFILISTAISFKFKDVYEVHEKKNESTVSKTLHLYMSDLKQSFKFIIKSRRMKAFILFQILFYGLIKITLTYSSDLLIQIGIPEQQYSMIIAIFTLVSGLALSLKEPMEKVFRNRTLTFIAVLYVSGYLVIGGAARVLDNATIIPIALIMLAIQNICAAIWYILEMKYLKNFTTEEMRNKITFTYEFIGAIAASIISILSGLLLKVVDIKTAFLIVGIVSFICMIIVLRYMKTRFGLKPEEYRKEDIEFETAIKS